MGDINLVKPMEKQIITKLEDMADDGGDGGAGNGINHGGASQAHIGVGAAVATNANDIDNIIQDEMVDINRFRY